MRDDKGRFVKGHSHSVDVLKKLSRTWFPKGLTPWIAGKKHTSETCKKMSIAGKGKRKSPESEFKAGKDNLNYTYGHTAYVKKFIKHGGQPVCKRCNKQDIFGTGRIIVHHKDHNKKNNKISNLVAVCHSCHLKIHRRGENI